MDVRKVIKDNRLKQYEIAEIMGISEFTLSRWLRKPENLPKYQREKIEIAIDILLKKGA